jgi:CBS domain-containing protein
MQVSDAMSRSPRTIGPDTKVVEVASLMCLYRFHGLPVVDEENRLVGVIAEKDVLYSLFPKIDRLMSEGMANVDLDQAMGEYKNVLDLPTSALMARNPVTVPPDMHLLRAATIMVRHGFRRIPVVENGKLVGVLSLGDVHKAIFHANMAGNLKGG